MESNSSENPLIEDFIDSTQEVKRKASEHEELRDSDEYQSELVFLERTIRDLIHSLSITTPEIINFPKHQIIARGLFIWNLIVS